MVRSAFSMGSKNLVFSKKSACLAVCLIGAFAAYSQSLPNSKSERSLSSAATLPRAEIFAPGTISEPANDGSPTFSPDGKALFFTRSSAQWSVILESHRVRGRWSEPKIAAFSGEWSDSSPAIAPDGSYLVFVSVRPITPDSTPAAQAGKHTNPVASHIWRVKRTGSGWSELNVVIDGKKYCLSGGYADGVLSPGDYKAKLVKDQHKTSYEADQTYEFLFPDNKTQRYNLIGQSE
jgi:Tol biopolymer transport system component